MPRIKRPSGPYVISIMALIAAIAVPAYALTRSEKRVIKKIADARITKRAPGLAAVGRSNFNPADCEDDNHTGEDCTSVALDLPRRARVLVTASASGFPNALDDTEGTGSGTDATTFAEGSCQIALDGAAAGPVALVSSNDATTDYRGVALNRVTLPLDPGTYTFTLHCEEHDGDIGWLDPSISAVMLGSR